jgi:hypothetical protein
MLRALRILVITAVLLCGLHIGEDARADEAGKQPAVELAFTDEAPTPAGEADQRVHHHCPVAQDADFALAFEDLPPSASLIFARPVSRLHSLSQAPPTQPPLA